MRFNRDDLRGLALLEGLSDEALDWFSEHGEVVELEAGARMFERGQVADAMWLVVEGSVQGFEEVGGQWLLVATTGAGEVTGMLPFSRMTHYPRNTVADGPARVLRIDASLFKDLLNVSHEVGRRLVAEMSDRVRGDVRLEQQGQRMMALGRLSAGLAHELNNPAAAVRRAAATLSQHRAKLPSLVIALVRHEVSEEGLQRLEQIRRAGTDGRPSAETALARSAREDELSEWLDGVDVPEPWEVAATLAESALTVRELEGLAELLPKDGLTDALSWLSAGIESDRLVEEIGSAAGRITELIASIKNYSHMDRSKEHKPTDVRVGLDNTLTMLGHKLRSKSIHVTCEYQEDLPLVPANAGELNQVWTNLIDNAVDAIEEGGNLTVRTLHNDIWVEIEIVDDGPGIPDDLRAQIFEPFFTTKEVGVGTGLGLGIALRIVRLHQGDMEVRSKPGKTEMCVRLPVAPAAPGSAATIA